MKNNNKKKNLIKLFYVLLMGFALLVALFIIINILVNCITIFAKDLPTENPLPTLIRQFQNIDIAPIIASILIAFILSLIVIHKYKPIAHVFSILSIAVALFLALDLALLFTGIIPIEEEIEKYSSCCAYLDSQPSQWFWIIVVLSAIIIPLSSALLTNAIINKYYFKKTLK